MSFARDLRILLTGRRFRQLFQVRVASQFADGVFQVALASYVFFSPERQPNAEAIAVALAAVLLPFSLLGPFAGVFLDRWNRRNVLVWCNAVRAVPVLVAAAIIATSRHDVALVVVVIVSFSINRFFLAGLSAALPRVVRPDDLVLANSLTPTSGTLAFMCGLALATGLSRIPGSLGGDVAIVMLAAVVYLTAAALATLIPPHLLGPDLDPTRPDVRRALGRIPSGLAAGLRHLHSRPVAAGALAVIAAHRFFYGLSTIATILLYRNYFNDPADTDAGLAGLSVAVVVSGLGFFLAAVLTPLATQRVTPHAWMLCLLGLAAIIEAFPGALYTEPTLLLAAFVLGLSAQGVKICVDTLVQTTVDDAFRGRIFSVYDVVFNVVFVAAAAVGTIVVPPTGKSYPLVAAISLGYAATAVAYAVWTRRRVAVA
ncbi:MAG: MFS transporter [Propionibacteriales bacterium]|nr:MFS transporter [Propionibacteriales bacterium]